MRKYKVFGMFYFDEQVSFSFGGLTRALGNSMHPERFSALSQIPDADLDTILTHCSNPARQCHGLMVDDHALERARNIWR
jgi:hypothetical protein